MQVEMRFVTVMRESVEEQCKGKETETESKNKEIKKTRIKVQKTSRIRDLQ